MALNLFSQIFFFLCGEGGGIKKRLNFGKGLFLVSLIVQFSHFPPLLILIPNIPKAPSISLYNLTAQW